MSPMIDLHRDGTALTAQRDAILRLLLARRPALECRLREGASGALSIDLPGGRTIEIGRMRRRGEVRWVVVSPRMTGLHDQVRVTDATTVIGVVRAALRALDELTTDEAAHAQRPGEPFRSPATVTA